MWLAAAALWAGWLATGCATQRNVALPQDVTYVIVSIGVRYRQEWPAGHHFRQERAILRSDGLQPLFRTVSQRGAGYRGGATGMTRCTATIRPNRSSSWPEIVKIKKFEVRGNRLYLTTEDGLKIEGVRAK